MILPEEVQPPFIRIIYSADPGIMTITAHDAPSPDNTGALFGVTLSKEEVLSMMKDWEYHLELSGNFIGSLKAQYNPTGKLGGAL